MKETSTGIVTRKGAENLHRIHKALQIWNRPDTCGWGSLSIEVTDFEELDDKPRILLVSEGFRPEVTAPVLWLRTFGLDISCVKLTPYKIDDNRIGIVSTTLIPLPEAGDYQVKAEIKDQGQKRIIDRSQFLASADENGRPIFEAILSLVDLHDLLIHWGTKGFSLNVDFEGDPLLLQKGRNPHSNMRRLSTICDRRPISMHDIE